MGEETKTQKKQWQKPELVVLVRSAPEEAVLTYCKAGPLDGEKTGTTNGKGPGCGYNKSRVCDTQCLANLRS